MGFEVFKEKENEIRGGNYERDAGFGDFTRRESRNLTLNKRDSGSSVTEINKENSNCHLSGCRK